MNIFELDDLGYEDIDSIISDLPVEEGKLLREHIQMLLDKIMLRDKIIVAYEQQEKRIRGMFQHAFLGMVTFEGVDQEAIKDSDFKEKNKYQKRTKSYVYWVCNPTRTILSTAEYDLIPLQDKPNYRMAVLNSKVDDYYEYLKLLQKGD